MEVLIAILAIAMLYPAYIVFAKLFLPALKIFLTIRKYEKVNGIVIDKIKLQVDVKYGISATITNYKYQIEYQGKTYEINDDNQNNNLRDLKIDDSIDIYIDKNNPKEYIPPNMENNRYFMLYTSFFMLLVFILMEVFVIINLLKA